MPDAGKGPLQAALATFLACRQPMEQRMADETLTEIEKGSYQASFYKLEREKSLELSTSTLARLRSTN